MALLTTQTLTKAGVVPSYGAVSSSDTITADSGLVLHVKNGGGSTDTVTLTDSGVTPGGSAATNPTVAVAAGAEKLIAIPASFQSSSTGLVTVAHSFTTSVTCAVFRIG